VYIDSSWPFFVSFRAAAAKNPGVFFFDAALKTQSEVRESQLAPSLEIRTRPRVLRWSSAWKQQLKTGTGGACAPLSEILPSARDARFVRMTQKMPSHAEANGE
jgi:hypothetical protein